MSIKPAWVVTAMLLGLTGALPARAPTELVLGISEGTSGSTDHARLVAKHGGLAEVPGRALKRKVGVVFLRESSSIDEGLKSGRLDLSMARPSDDPASACRA